MSKVPSESRRLFLQALGRSIRERRQAMAWPQSYIAQKVGITQASLSNYENGKRDMPFTTAIELAHALYPSLESDAALRRLYQRAFDLPRKRRAA